MPGPAGGASDAGGAALRRDGSWLAAAGAVATVATDVSAGEMEIIP
jgi:hypothetical protein